MAVDSSTTTGSTNKYDYLNKSSEDATKTAKAAAEAANRALAKKKTSLGQEDFLKLMTAQMTHQDPNEPMKNGEFLSQMAQFGTVSGIQDLQASFATLANSVNSNQSLQAASLVGNYVAVQSGQGVLEAGGDLSGTVGLTSSTPDLQIAISNASTGELVKTIDLGNQSEGDIPFSWDGTNEAGTLASPGTYKVAASGYVNGKNTMLPTDMRMKVESVVMANTATGTGMQVDLADKSRVSFSKIKQILSKAG